jgi:2-dehydropantoate 2-reductase
MRVLIYGAGAVGCAIGGHLALAGHTVTLLGRKPLVEVVQADGLTVRTPTGTRRARSIRAVTGLEDALAGGEGYDWIAFTMKSYDTVPAIFELQEHLPEPPPIASFQGGVGNEESLEAAFGAERAAAAAMTTPVSMTGPGVVVEERGGKLALATDTPAAGPVREALAGTDLAVEVVGDRQSLKWSKLLLDITGNATSAILDMPRADIFRRRDLFAVERGALLEALAITELLGIEIVDLPGAPARRLVNLARRLPPFLARPALRRWSLKAHGERVPSLLAALRAGERRTEVAWLNGAVAQAADRIDRLAPINHALALTVSDIAAGRAPWEMFRHKPDMLLAAVRAAQ